MRQRDQGAALRIDRGESGLHRLRGVRQKLTVLLPGKTNLELDRAEALEAEGRDARSEAEQVMLLYRDARSRKPDQRQRIPMLSRGLN